MIIRKPYAFLIKHFKKIHILLLALSAFVYYKNLQLSAFVNEFMSLGTYDIYNEPINKFVSFPVILALLILVVGSIMLAFLLHHKKKPWKLYIMPVVEYAFMLMLFITTKSFFDSYQGTLDSATIRAIRDFLFITTVIQYPVMIIFLMRIVGVDLKKFNFNMDEEYLSLNNEDREELEINIDFDKESIKRGAKRLLRNLSYFYLENKFILNIIFGIISVILLYNSYTFIFVTNKSYKQGESLGAEGYSITINDSYYSDKDYTGNTISEKSAFVIVDLTMTNHTKKREVNLQNFHIMNGVNNYTTTEKVYQTEFQDFGKTHKDLELKTDESARFILIFKVDKKLSTKRFVLYYQEFNNNQPHLRKIKLKINDVSEIKDNGVLTIGDELKFKLANKDEFISFEEPKIAQEVEYSTRVCLKSNCGTTTKMINAGEGNKFLKIPFASNNFEGKDMIDFSIKYGKINYIDSKGKKKSIQIKKPFNNTYYGKYLYVKIPDEVANSKTLEIEYIIRNNKYTYKIK